MGVIKFVSSEEVPKPSWTSGNGTFRKLYTSNWRLLREIVGQKKIIIINRAFQMFKIYDIDLQEFHNTNKKPPEAIKKPFTYLRNSLSCLSCHGSGRVDWIQKVTGIDLKTPRFLTKKYNRDPSQIVLLKSLPVHKLEKIYGSVPKLQFGDEVCPTCKGCGIHSLKFVDYMTRVGS